MAINFPILPHGSSTTIKLASSAVDQVPFLGSPAQRVARLGDKWAVAIECRKMFAKQAGPVIAALIGGLSEHVIMTVPQPGIDTAVWGSGTIAAAVASGRQIRISGGGAAKQVGQLLSIEKNGIHFLHQVSAVTGNNLTIQPALKVPLSGNEAIDFATPKIMGFVSGNSASWTVGLAENVGLSFEITEAY